MLMKPVLRSNEFEKTLKLRRLAAQTALPPIEKEPSRREALF